jgi:mono/diheme cytochrome c family protein
VRLPKHIRTAWRALWLGAVCGIAGCARQEAEEPTHPLVWDALQKSAAPKFEDGVARFEFHVTNRAKQPVKIYYVRPSCGCTTVEAPPMPWILAPGEQGTVKAVVDFRGKEGEIAKDLLVGTVEGPQRLTMLIQVPPMSPAMRERNQALAAANRQSVFQGDCAACHATPAEDRFGDDLFEAVCAVCHQSKHQASMVPDLKIAKEKRDATWWKHWVEEGRPGTLMPGFAQKQGGPLSDTQIDSLVEYLLTAFPTEPKTN